MLIPEVIEKLEESEDMIQEVADGERDSYTCGGAFYKIVARRDADERLIIIVEDK